MKDWQKTAFCVYAWLKTLRWPDSIEPCQVNDVGISYLELFANVLLVTGVTLPITIKRVGSKIHWEHFDSPRAYIQPKRTRAAIVQSVVLDNVVAQLEKILNEKFFFVPKKLGVKTLSHLGHTQLQKRTGYIRRPEMKFGKETLMLVDHFLHDCREQNNWNLPMIPKRYLGSLPLPIQLDIPDGITELTPAAVEYHKKRFLRLHRWVFCFADVDISCLAVFSVGYNCLDIPFLQVPTRWLDQTRSCDHVRNHIYIYRLMERSSWSLDGCSDSVFSMVPCPRQSCRGRSLWVLMLMRVRRRTDKPHLQKS